MSEQDDSPQEQEQGELIISRDKLKSFLPALNHEVTDDGYIRHRETEKIATTEDGEAITIDEVGYLGTSDDDDETITLVRDDFTNVVSHLSDRDLPQRN